MPLRRLWLRSRNRIIETAHPRKTLVELRPPIPLLGLRGGSWWDHEVGERQWAGERPGYSMRSLSGGSEKDPPRVEEDEDQEPA